ncbi:hypothetical protein [Streptomyces lavendofoliae]|uniref:Uncharacterized protein n=1 Tax=Streptomyces lavendofoliae TaxID=67314 RepID=A0A918HVU6_9ACTN|nr:hypothetical protein [Streptomyces lavendofoliae]GGU35135.1 hypothetical protein GCM10010274_22970 [Streptomyces lavendofoliae]
MPTSEQKVSMRDLLASCAAASAVSTPPSATDAETDADADTGHVPGSPLRDARSDAPRPAPERRRAA